MERCGTVNSGDHELSHTLIHLRHTRSIENAQKNPAEIDKWIQSINDLHRTKPPPQVIYATKGWMGCRYFCTICTRFVELSRELRNCCPRKYMYNRYRSLRLITSRRIGRFRAPSCTRPSYSALCPVPSPMARCPDSRAHHREPVSAVVLVFAF